MKAAPRNKSPLILSSHDEELVRTIYQYRYMTAEDMAYHRISPKTIPYVRRRLMRLSGGTTHHTNTYLYCFQLPKVDLGRPQKIFTLGVKGRDFLVREVGLPVDWYFRPYKLKHLGFSHLMHALLQTRLVVAATYWSRKQSQYTLTHALMSHQLARMFKLTVIPDAWLLCEDSQGTKYQILLEIDRGMEYQAAFKRHVKARLAFLESEAYTEVLGFRSVLVAYVTTGQRPEYRETRRESMARWTQEVLQELKMEDWAGIFRFTSVVFDEVYESGIFEKALWYRPDADSPVPLLTP